MTEISKNLCFIDSNVWLYSFSTDQRDETKRLIAKDLIKTQDKSIVISTQVINEVSCNLLKKHKFDESNLLNLVISFYGKYQISAFNLSILESASNLRTRYNLSFWDSLIVAIALFSGATILYSEDMQDGLIIDNQLTIINPFKI